MVTIAVADDDPQVADILHWYLDDSYRLVSTQEGTGLREFITHENPALLVLDVMLPGMSGLDILRDIRKMSRLPVILLTARSQESQIIEGLSIGADDYITKPFSPREVKSRIETVLRRSLYQEPQRHAIGNLFMDRDSHQVIYCGRHIELTGKEFEILWILAVNRGQVFSRAHLLQTLSDFDSSERTVDAHIKNLRKKLQSPLVETMYGLGYRLNTETV